MIDQAKIKAWLQLLAAPDIGNSKAIRLTELLGDPQTFLGKDNLLNDIDLISDSARKYLLSPPEPENWQNTKKLISHYNIEFTSCLDSNYPLLLKHIYDPPPFLFHRGSLNRDILRRTIAIVGTRIASSYGKQMAKEISESLVKYGFTIVSGLAYGIDSIAHNSAVKNGGKTIAVLGTGVDQIYPPENKDLAKKIINNGALISEYIPGSKAEKWNFPNRNRIISGLSLGCLIIEGSLKSGALLTGKFALDQNRDLFALPGDIYRMQAEGPNYLIKLGAKIVTSVNDILEEYDIRLEDQIKIFPDLTIKEDEIWQLLIKNKPEISFDDLLIQSKLTIGELSGVILSLELKNVIKRTPGNKIVPLG
jgi:DNA processing protein